MIDARSETQFILYAKHHFLESNRYYDLAILMSDYCMVDVQDVSLDDLRYKMIHIITDLGLLSNDRQINLFFEAISPNNYYRWAITDIDDTKLCHMYRAHPNYNYNKAVISACLSVIATMQEFNAGEILVQLNEPDFTLIPKREPFPSEEK